MREILALGMILFCLNLLGCSVPSAARYQQLYSFIREEKKVKSGMSKRKIVSIKDFRENDRYEEDMAALKEEVEKYILAHPDLNEQAKSNLRELKVALSATKDEVSLLLGKPKKIIRAQSNANPYNASEIWTYRINKIRAFTVFIIPIFLVHEGYYLYFKDNALVGIERHYLKQIVQQGSAPGLPTSRDKTSKQ